MVFFSFRLGDWFPGAGPLWEAGVRSGGAWSGGGFSIPRFSAACLIPHGRLARGGEHFGGTHLVLEGDLASLRFPLGGWLPGVVRLWGVFNVVRGAWGFAGWLGCPSSSVGLRLGV